MYLVEGLKWRRLRWKASMWKKNFKLVLLEGSMQPQTGRVRSVVLGCDLENRLCDVNFMKETMIENIWARRHF